MTENQDFDFMALLDEPNYADEEKKLDHLLTRNQDIMAHVINELNQVLCLSERKLDLILELVLEYLRISLLEEHVESPFYRCFLNLKTIGFGHWFHAFSHQNTQKIIGWSRRHTYHVGFSEELSKAETSNLFRLGVLVRNKRGLCEYHNVYFASSEHDLVWNYLAKHEDQSFPFLKTTLALDHTIIKYGWD
jgi:hypothetical protein